MSASKKDSPTRKPTIIDALRKARDNGLNVKIGKDGIEVSVPEKTKKSDPKASLSQISPEEEKQIEKELKEMLKPKGEKNAHNNNESDSR